MLSASRIFERSISNSMKLAIHQPNYLPWLGYFSKIYQADHFVFLDDCQFTKGGWQNRVKILNANGSFLISQPLSRPAFKMTNMITFSSLRWKQDHLKSIKASYRRHPYFTSFYPVLEQIISHESDYLSTFNSEAIKSISSYLVLRTTFSFASETPLESSSTVRLLELCAHYKATTYLCGSGSSNYLDITLFDDANISIQYVVAPQESYFQPKRTAFTSGLSIIDACFSLSPKEVQLYLSKFVVSTSLPSSNG